VAEAAGYAQAQPKKVTTKNRIIRGPAKLKNKVLSLLR